MSSESSSAISAEFQGTETLSNIENFNTEFFKTAIIKDFKI